jgi:phosphatidylserine/phosphatidylglycerophosphate/cardiolipin synthase-like enzyme
MTMLGRIRLPVLILLLVAGCATTPPPGADQSPRPAQVAAGPAPQIEVAFSPDAGSEALVLKVIGSAQQSLRLAGYSFTSPAVVRALIEDRKRGVDVMVLVDDKGNRSRSSVIAMKLIADAGIPIRVIGTFAIHHDKYIVVDGKTTETGSFNYSQAAARSNSENLLVVWNDPQVASTYLAHWASRWAQGVAISPSAP